VPLTPGTRLGPYDITGAIGAGGMGEVYRARDTKLNRDVAIKVLPDAFALDPERLPRFTREAQVLASLNHSNIAAIYGIEGTALVMELVEGEDLSAHIARGAMPLAESLPIARQIADALEAAHEQGIVHRDLKPANVKVRADGMVKVLDFGLAKAMDPAGASGTNVANSPTLTARATQMGTILGTAAYMAPEQARGKIVDRRADIWAFGVVLYEMLTGRRAFEGDEVSDVLAAVLRQDIDWTRLPATTPLRLRALLERCLDRDPKTRLRDIGEARVELAKIASGAPDTTTAVAAGTPAAALPRARSNRLAWGIAALAVAGLATVIVLRPPWTSTPAPVPVRFTYEPPAASALSVNTTDRNFAISPDGSRVAYVTNAGGLFVRALDSLDTTPLRGITNARQPFFSPNGQWIGFFDQVGIKKVSITGGPAIPICSNGSLPRGASWGADDTIIFATTDYTSGLLAVPAAGGDATILTHADNKRGEVDHVQPFVLSEGSLVLFTIVPTSTQVEAMQVAVLDRRTGRTTTLIHGGSDASYVESPSGGPGFLVYASAGTLRAVRFDPKTLSVSGEPLPVVDGLEMVSTGAAEYGVSRSGTLVYLPGTLNGQAASRTLAWIDRKTGRETPIAKAPPRAYFALRLSPDDTRVALDIRDQDNDIYVWQLANQTLMRLTFQSGVDGLPVWTPDGRKVVYYSISGGNNLFWQLADGSGAAERLTNSPNSQAPLGFSPDGTRLLLRERGGTTGDDIKMLTMDTRQTTPLIQTSFNENNGQVSPDGKWVAYESNDGVVSQIYVCPFPDVSKGRWQVSSAGGSRPIWSKKGTELFYETDTAIMAVPVQTSGGFTFGGAAKLFDLRPVPGLLSGRHYDATADGQRFIVIKDPPPNPSNPSAASALTVVLHWSAELERKVNAK
jgi:serine/threonine-protein kinase